MKKERRKRIRRILARASAGAALGIATYVLVKSDKPNVLTKKVDKDEPKQEELFI